MNIINIHIDETLDAENIELLKDELLHVPHVNHVEMRAELPHDLMVEFEEEYDIPMTVLSRLSNHGLHSYIAYG